MFNDNLFTFIFKAKLKLESGNQKIQYDRQADILKLTSLKINRLLPIYISTVPLKFGLDIQSQTKVRVRKPKIQYGRKAAIFKLMSLKINRPLPIYICIVPLKFGVDVHSQTKVRVWKPKIPKWPLGDHFESDVVENYNMTVWILARNDIYFSMAAGLIRLHMPCVK